MTQARKKAASKDVVLISMLRGVNLGPHRRMKMDALRAAYEAAGARDPQTLLQSGNVVFRSSDSDLLAVAAKIEKAIERNFGFHSDVVLRTIPELREIISRNPFVKRTDIEPARLLVTFLIADPGAAACAEVLKIKCDPEELRIHGRELFVYYPDGMGRSKLSFAAIDRALKTSGTGRNWNTVTKLLELAERMANSPNS